MHTSAYTSCRIHHNGGFDGDIYITNKDSTSKPVGKKLRFLVYVSRPVRVKVAGRKQFLEMINDWREERGLDSIGMTRMSFMLSDTFPKENNPLKDFENWEDLIK